MKHLKWILRKGSYTEQNHQNLKKGSPPPESEDSTVLANFDKLWALPTGTGRESFEKLAENETKH